MMLVKTATTTVKMSLIILNDDEGVDITAEAAVVSDLRVGLGAVVIIMVVISEVLHGLTVPNELHGHSDACVVHVVPRCSHVHGAAKYTLDDRIFHTLDSACISKKKSSYKISALMGSD
jgi:hypothetical protein